MYEKAINDFETVELIKDNVLVEIDWLEDGLSGEYQADDPDDVPMLRFTVCSCPYVDTEFRHWDPVRNASYVMQIPIDTPRAVLEKLAQKIMDKVFDEIQAGNSIKEICEKLSSIENEGCPECGSEAGYTGRLIEHHAARFDYRGNWVEDLGCEDSGPYGGPYTCRDCGAELDEMPGSETNMD